MTHALHPRAQLPDARNIVANPDLHSKQDVLQACDLMIGFGSSADLLQAQLVRNAIDRGDIVPGRTRGARRLTVTLLILCAVVWALALGLSQLVAAQQSGALPSIQEILLP